jgi:hypothetical protein
MKSGTGTEEVYKPQLWYFGLLSFLIDHEIPTESVDNLDLADIDGPSHLPESEDVIDQQVERQQETISAQSLLLLSAVENAK